VESKLKLEVGQTYINTNEQEVEIIRELSPDRVAGIKVDVRGHEHISTYYMDGRAASYTSNLVKKKPVYEVYEGWTNIYVTSNGLIVSETFFTEKDSKRFTTDNIKTYIKTVYTKYEKEIE
jgi:hypothetical protein